MAANRAEIDTSAPFRSVKEAVMLFGERVLAGEVYANKLKEMHDKAMSKPDHGAMASEETNQSLEKNHDETSHMARFLSSLQKELEQTERELDKLKARASNSETEDLKLVDGTKKITEQGKTEMCVDINSRAHESSVEFDKKRCVSLGNHSMVAHMAVPSPPPVGEVAVLEKHPSITKKKKKKKQLIPNFFGGIFYKKSLA